MADIPFRSMRCSGSCRLQPDPPVLGSICLEEPTNQEEDDVAQTPPESLSLEEPEDDEQAPTPHEEEPVGALGPLGCFTEMCNSVYKQIVPWENI